MIYPSTALKASEIRYRQVDSLLAGFSHHDEPAYGGTGPKFCRLHKRGPPSPPPVEPTKLRACTSVMSSHSARAAVDLG